MAQTSARLLHRGRLVLDDGVVVEMVIWRVSEPVTGGRHRYEYRRYYGRSGERLVGYENERGKGDHRHCRGEKAANSVRSNSDRSKRLKVEKSMFLVR